MKKILYTLMAIAISTSLAYAHSKDTYDWSKDKAAEIAQFVSSLKDKTIQMPGSLIKEWTNVKAKMILLKAQELADMLPQMPQQYKQPYANLIDTMQDLAQQLKALPVPQQNVPVSFKYLPAKLALKAKFLNLMSKKLAVIAQQTQNPVVAKMAQQKAKVAQGILNGMMQAQQTMQHPARTVTQRGAQDMTDMQTAIPVRLIIIAKEED